MINKSNAAKIAVLATFVAYFPTAANADNGQCSALLKSQHGFELGAGSSAHKYSKEHKGAVGISIFPGADLIESGFTAAQLGSALVATLNKKGVEAECFISNSYYENNGTALGFQVDGLGISVDGSDNFGVRQLQIDKRILSAAVAEAKTAKLLLK